MFTVLLLALVIVPQHARKAAAALRPTVALRPDTESTVATIADAQRQVTAAESLFTQARTDFAQYIAAMAAKTAIDTTAARNILSTSVRNRRDSLASQISLLGQLIARSENAPLLGSYRVLAQATPLQGDARVKQQLDSLIEIERERESYSAVGGVDPVFVALTARANELGRNIEVLADARRAAIKRELSSLAPAAPVATTTLTLRPIPDTLARMQVRDTARVAVARVSKQLTHERAELLRLDGRETRARELSEVGASPSALLAAALLFGAVFGFGVSLYDEVRRPRIADAYEVEQATGVRVLGEIRPLPHSPERNRRSADRLGPSYIDPGPDDYQLMYLTIVTAGVNTVLLTITGDSPAVVAVVAVNFAAIAAGEARSTLLIDTGGDTSSVTTALRLRTSTGLRGLVTGLAKWPEVTRTARVGRDRTVDVVPSGEGMVPLDQLMALLQRDTTRLTRHYDAIVLVSAEEQVLGGLPTAIPVPDVLYCARTGLTHITELKRAIAEIEQTGARTRGIVLWNAPDPVLVDIRSPEETEATAPIAVEVA